MMTRRLLPLVFILLAAFTVQAEEQAPQRWSVQVFTINPGTAPMFEALVMRYKEAAEKVGSPPWYAYSPGIGNDFEYSFAMPVDSFTMFADDNDIVLEAFGEEEAMKVGELARTSVADLQSLIVVSRPDLSIAPPERETPPEISVVYAITLKQGVAEEWDAWMKELVAVTRQTEPSAYWTAFQGNIGMPNGFGLRIPMDWADLDAPPPKSILQRMQEAHGERKGKRMLDEAEALVESLEVTVDRLRLDLSHVPMQE